MQFLILLQLCLWWSIDASIINKSVSRIVDATSSVVRVHTDISVTGVDGGEYDLIYPNDVAEHIALLTVKSKNKKLTVRPPVMNGDFTVYTVEVSEASPSLKVDTVLTSVLQAYPAEILQREDQFVRLHDSHYFISPYPTTTQKSNFKLASATVESFTKLSPFSARGSSLQFGPYTDIEAYAVSPVVVHYMNNFPFAKFSSVTRELEVSHWGSVSVEEIFELQHAGAALKGGFSRIDHQMLRGGPTPSFRSLTATLPAQASNIYYRDQIGNISTSDLRTDADGDLELEVEMRFPMYGGWQTQFYLGYQLPTEQLLFVDASGSDSGSRYQLKADFFPPFADVWTDSMELKVVLPEGATDVRVSVPYPGVEQDSATRFTYLDSEFNGGRPVVILRASNLVEEHDAQAVISYAFSSPRMVIEPLMLVACFFAFFCVCSLLARASAISSSSSSASFIGSSSSKGDAATPAGSSGK